MRILDVVHVRGRGTSFSITLPVKVSRKFELTYDNFLVFDEKDGEIVLRKMKMEDSS